jgi:bifunctional DNA-binding transcriptional regulator/antitoxin component of YhaV-PrlF toxin-antitoxin module
MVVPADLRAALGFEEGSTVVAYIEGEGRLVIESPEAIQRALLEEWSEVAGGASLVDDLRAERRAAAAREAEQVQADADRVQVHVHPEHSQADPERVQADRAGHRRQAPG